MNKMSPFLPAIILIAGLCFSCSAKRTVILVPNPDGQTGKAEISTADGKQLLESPYAMTTYTTGKQSPSVVQTASPEYIESIFAQALAAEPLPSEKFIIYFNTSTNVPTEESLATIAKVIESIKRRNAFSIKISGHADATGSSQVNDRLSNARARAISGILIQKGVAASKIEVSSHGKGNQLIPTADGVAEPRNRRVEVVVR
jgi:outer membrane protein OmpA-like peptidoglycan-associated protein